ncbi:hypothetical protein J6590_076944 [Homalodisca vitripennis]|nr:hypothetical protein J6590_076944 [Homalodisca vitripennis]
MSRKKLGIWHFLFGEKKCKVCLKKKALCSCNTGTKTLEKNTQSDSNTKEPRNENKPNVIFNGKSTEILKGQNYRKNSVPVLEKNGWGCHLYFSVNSKHKPNQPKCKTVKDLRNQSIKTKITEGSAIKRHENIIFDNEGPKITIVCDECPDISSSDLQRNPPEIVIKKGEGESRNVNSDVSINTFPFQASSKGASTGFIKPKIEQNYKVLVENSSRVNNKKSDQKLALETNNEVQNDTNQPLLRENPGILHNPSVDKSIGSEQLGTARQKKRSSVETQGSGSSELSGIIKTNTILKKPREKVSPNISLLSNIRSLGNLKHIEEMNYGKPKINFKPPEEVQPNGEEDTILKDYELYKKSPRVTKSGTFVRNSLITLRREQRQSILQGGIFLIMNKLEQIDKKIKKLEKKNTDGKVTMGIVCDNRESSVAVKFNKVKKEEEVNEITTMKLRPSVDESNKIVQVKSPSECVFVSAPGEVKVVQKRCSNRTVKDVTHHNSFEIDAHTLGTNFMPIKCTNPKILIECPQKVFTCTGPEENHQWRRISEELKMSKPDVTK